MDTACTSKSELRSDSLLTDQQTSKPIVPRLSLPMTHICRNGCVWCSMSFALYDNPNHIGRIKNVDKQNSFLKMKSFLKFDSCLCDGCWRILEKTYNLDKRQKIKGVCSDSNDTDRNFEVEPTTTIKPITQSSEICDTSNDETFFCSVHKCRTNYGLHPLSSNKYIKINKILLEADIRSINLIKPQKWGSNQHGPTSLSVCEKHFYMINVLITCQLCGNELGANLDTNDWKMYDQWNCTLKCYNIPLKLLPGMYLCDTCQSFVSNGVLFPTVDLKSLRTNVKRKNATRLKLSGRLESDTKKNNKPENVLRVHFAEPLVTSTYYYARNINHQLLKNKKIKLDYSKESTDAKVEPNANIVLVLPSTDGNIDSDNNNNASSRIETVDISFPNDIKAKHDILSTNTEKKTNLKGLNKYSDNISTHSHNLRSNHRVRKLINLVSNGGYGETEGASLTLLRQNEECSLRSLIRRSADIVLSTIDDSSKNFTRNMSAGTAKIDNETDLLQLPLCSVLRSNDKITCYKTDQHNLNCTSSVQSNSIGKEIENVSELFLQQNDDLSKSSVDSKHLTIEDSIFEKKDLNNFGHGTNVLVPKEPKNLSGNPTEIGKKCDIFNQLDKTEKQKCNDIFIKEAYSSFLDECIKDSTIKSKIRANFNYKTPDSPCALSLLLLETNENILNLDHNDVDGQNKSCDKNKQTTTSIGLDDVQSTISSDEYEEIIVTNSSANLQSMLCDEDEETIVPNESINYVQNISSDEYEEITVTDYSVYLKSIPCDGNEKTIMSNDSIIDISSDDEMINSNDSNWKNCFSPNDLNTDKTSLCAGSNFSLKPLQLKRTSKKIPASTDKITSSSTDECSSGINQFHNQSKGKIFSKHKCIKNDNVNKLRFRLDNRKEHIYKNLLARFNYDSSAMFSYLMENERLLRSGQLVLSDKRKPPHVTNYVKNHLNALSKWCGEPKDHNLSKSFIPASKNLSLDNNSHFCSPSSVLNRVCRVQKNTPFPTYLSSSVDSCSANKVTRVHRNVTYPTLAYTPSVKSNLLPPFIPPRHGLNNVGQHQPVTRFQSSTAVRTHPFVPRRPLSFPLKTKIRKTRL